MTAKMHDNSIPFQGSLHVADLARSAGVTPATVRYYARIGLINSRKDPHNGYRCFSGADAKRIAFVRRAQAFGLTIGDIKRIFEAIKDGDNPCELVKSMVEDRLVAVRGRISELKTTEDCILKAFSAWRAMGDPLPADGELCPLVERLEVDNADRQMRNGHHHLPMVGHSGANPRQMQSTG